MFYDIMQITIISIAALIAIIYLSICQKQHAELYNKVFEARFTHDLSAESVEKYRRNHVNCNLLPYRIDADVLY